MTLPEHLLFSVMVNAAVLVALAFCRSVPPRLVLNVCLAGMSAAAVPWGLIGERLAVPQVVQESAMLLHPSGVLLADGAAMIPVAGWHWSTGLALLWLTVAVSWLGITFGQAALIRRRWRRRARPAGPCVALVAGPLRELAEQVEIYRVPGSRLAASTGLRRREIWLGDGISNPTHVAVALDHELCHLSAGDHYVIHLVTMIERMLWWNPLIWILGRIGRRHLEYDCDQRCKRLLGGDTYQRTLTELVISIGGHEPPAAAPASACRLTIGKPSGLVKRMERLTMTNRTRPVHRMLLAGLVGVIVLGCGALSADEQKPTLLSCNEHLPQGVHYRLKIEYDPDTRGDDVHGNLSATLLDQLKPGSIEVPDGSGRYARCVLQVMGVPERELPADAGF